MSLNSTPVSHRLHIGLFGKRNAGKSSVINAVTGQDLAIVSDVLGTTTDPVYKAMEILPIGPVMLIDTPGLDDTGELGKLRVKKSIEVLNKTDVAIIVIDGSNESCEEENQIIKKCKSKNIPFIVAINKMDLIKDKKDICLSSDVEPIYVSAKAGENIDKLKQKIASLAKNKKEVPSLVEGFINPSDFALLVVPIDSAAPKGRLILPQQQVIRDILDMGATALICKDTELKSTLQNFGKAPSVVITDSQVFGAVSKIVPQNILLTSFSILFANKNGILKDAVKGVKALDDIKSGDKILISEGCTHHRQCDDIGTVKIPNMISSFTNCEPVFEFSSGGGFPEENLNNYKLIVHCGGCMLPEKVMEQRLNSANNLMVPITNYGVLMAYLTGILKRSVEVFPEVASLL